MGINLFIIHYITYYGLVMAFEITVHFIRLIEHYIYIALDLKATLYKRRICLDLLGNLNTKRTVYTGQRSQMHMIMQCKNNNDISVSLYLFMNSLRSDEHTNSKGQVLMAMQAKIAHQTTPL